MAAVLPVPDNLRLYDPRQVEDYLKLLFRNVDWEDGQLISLLGIGEKGTTQEGKFRERQIVPPAFIGSAHERLKRWAQWHVASFIVPAVVKGTAAEKGDVKLEQIAALTAIILDIDSGDTEAKRSYATAALGRPSLIVASGGKTEAKTDKLHLYWLFNEAEADVERVAAMRKALAQKIGGDASFGRATQVIRIPGTVHAKNGQATTCRIVDRCDAEYSFDDLADIIANLQPMAGIEVAKPEPAGGLMDFTPNFDNAVAALHRDVHEGGEDLTRFSEFSKVAGFQIAEARAGRTDLDRAFVNTLGWMNMHMLPPWPEDRARNEFAALVKVDVDRHGPFTVPLLQVAQMQPAAATIAPTPALFPLPSMIPPRPWLFGRWLMRGKVTLMLAPGGIGKSTLTNGIALSCATGRELLGKTVYGGPLRAWLWNLEDDGDSLARQRVAAAMHFGIKPEDVEGRFFVDSGPDGAELCTAVEDKNSFSIIEPVMENVTAAIMKLGIDVLIVDPFVSSHRVNENDNNKIDAVAKRWARVAVAAQCSIVLVHHSRKLDGNAVTTDAARGAGALANAARIALVLNRMEPEQAEMWQLPPQEHRSYFSVSDDKHNLSAPESADWFKLVSVDLGNKSDIHEADSVGVAAPWKPPQALDGVDLDHLFMIQRALQSGDYWRHQSTRGDSKEPTAHNVIANVLKLDLSQGAAKKRVEKLLSLWIGNGTLIEEVRKDRHRNNKTAVGVGRWVIEPHHAHLHLRESTLSEMESDNG